MDHKKQIEIFDKELVKFIDKFAREFNLTYAEIIGVLEIRKIEMVTKAKK